MITEITPEQEKHLEVIKEKWIKIGLKTGKTYQKGAKEAIHAIYKRGGFKPPKEIVFVKSPIEAHELLVERKYTTKHHFVSPALYGNFEAHWSAFYEAHKYLGVTGIDAEGLVMLSKYAGWTWVYPDLAVVSDRPSVLLFDEEGQLHATDGAAVQYRDGVKYYFWHGVSIPDWIIETPEKITAEEVLKTNNQEVRRAMLEKGGYDLFLDRAEKLHTDESGTLYRLKLDTEEEEITFVRVKCPSTDRVYCLRVPPTTERALEGVAWTFHIDEKTYKPSKQT
jgi:hypothetical protein